MPDRSRLLQRRSGGAGRRRQRGTPAPSGRYTPPVPRRHRASPAWMGVLLLGLLVAGLLVIIVNYLGVLPGGATTWSLLVGLALICAGFLLATRYR
ncbi:MAG TPA: cell division protein CrgA [Acidimicrobiales bacterium]|nr:cell division protein CrgA [Acidimicrobiales bacterium]